MIWRRGTFKAPMRRVAFNVHSLNVPFGWITGSLARGRPVNYELGTSKQN
jgi:hypothetical protein